MRFKTFLSIGVIFLCSSVLALAALDLRFTTAITQAPDPANTGDTVTFTVSFKTFGGAVDNLKIIGGVDGVNIYTRTYAHIDADKQRTDTFSWTATAGAHTAWFELDPDHTSGDSDYSNNRVEKALTVGGGGPTGQPNLKPNVSYSPSSFNAGDTVTFTITVTNNGDVASVACKMTIKEGTTLKQELNVPAINASNTSPSQTYAWTAVCDAVINIKVDSNSLNTESDETDNTWSKTMKCGSILIPGDWWKKYRFIAKFKPIPLPDPPCAGCPWWHMVPKPGDPLELLDKIGNKLGQGGKFEDIKGDWLLFLKNNNGLDPNAALRRIFNKATEGGASRFGIEANALKFQNSLNNILNQLGGAANEFLK